MEYGANRRPTKNNNGGGDSQGKGISLKDGQTDRRTQEGGEEQREMEGTKRHLYCRGRTDGGMAHVPTGWQLLSVSVNIKKNQLHFLLSHPLNYLCLHFPGAYLL